MQRAAGQPDRTGPSASAYATLLQEVDEYAAAMRLSNEAMLIVDRGGEKMTA